MVGLLAARGGGGAPPVGLEGIGGGKGLGGGVCNGMISKGWG